MRPSFNNMADPFGMIGAPRASLTGPERNTVSCFYVNYTPMKVCHVKDNSHALVMRNDTMWPFGGRSPFDSMFSQFVSTQQTPNLVQLPLTLLLQEQMANNPNAHTFSSSTVMSYSSGGDGSQPQMYRASKSTRTGPGGVSVVLC